MPPDPSPQPIIPDSIEPYIGYKALSVSFYDDLLRSPAFAQRWDTGQKSVATCWQYPLPHLPSDAPMSVCHCGFYCVDFNARYRIAMYLHETRGVVVKVALWGRTIVANHGARGQFAYPQEIMAWTCTDLKIQKVAENYGIEVATENHGFGWPSRAVEVTA